MQPFQLQSSNFVAISGDMESFTLAAACFQFMLLAAAAGVAVIGDNHIKKRPRAALRTIPRMITLASVEAT